ncbi:MAG TPA: PAS domain S-box protein, partial [Hyphomicrobiaceae bacterium]|nr:PAS domain S-box protein [Hyphomicrobiaceae bacterium]
NSQWTTYTGLTARESQGDGWMRALHPDDVAPVAAWWRSCVEGSGQPMMRYRLRAADGNHRWYQVQATAMRDADGKIMRWVGNLIDIHDQVTTEAQLKVVDARYRDLVEMSQDAIYIRSRGKFVFVNGATARLFGVASAADLIGKSPLDFVHPDFVAGLKKRWVELERRRRPLPPYELKLVRRDGSILDVESVASPITFNGRSAAHVVVRDISERKALERRNVDLVYEQAARAQAVALANHFQLLAEAVPNIVWTTATDGYLDYVNRRLLDYIGCAFEEIEGWKWARIIHPDDLPVCQSRWAQSLSTGEAFEIEQRLLRSDGAYRWHITRALPVREDNGQIVKWVGTCIDIDDQKQAQAMLKSSRARLETAVMLRTQELLQANTALRASEDKLRKLSAHLQSAREAERALISREIHDELGASLTAAKMDLSRCLKTLPGIPPTAHDLLAGVIALIDSSIHTVRRIATELRPSILDHLGLWPALEWQLEEFENRYGVQCSVDFDAMPVTLGKDAQTAVFRIVQEALTNVARHARATRVRVVVSEKDHRLRINLSDNGTGIPAEKLNDPTSCGIQGMRERAAAFGGELVLQSAAGAGTNLTISFPLARRAPGEAPGKAA